MSDIRYKRVAYAALRVSNLENSRKFQEEIVGLQYGGASEGGAHFFRCGDDHHCLILTQGDGPELERVGFEVEAPQDIDKAKKYLQSIGIVVSEVGVAELAELHQGRSIRFEEPHTGLCIELFESMERVADPFVATVSKIERLGHVVVGAIDPAATIRFFTDHLNFKVSDSVGEMVTFMRCFPNPLHHSFAISAASENRLHHVNFMVTDMDDIGSGNNRLKRADVPIVYGPGRHPPSGSVFLYFLDPDGMTFEYSYGMEEFPEVDPRQSRRLEPNFESFDFWGGDAPDERFAKVGRIVPSCGKQSADNVMRQESHGKV